MHTYSELIIRLDDDERTLIEQALALETKRLQLVSGSLAMSALESELAELYHDIGVLISLNIAELPF